jgi:tRNA(Ile)-lysidine synthase
MDDLAETMVLNLLWGAGLEGLSPHVRTETAPLLTLRRAELRAYVEASGRPFILDPTNDDRRFRRNAVRHDVLALLSDVGDRDVVPLLARSARLIGDEVAWLDEVTREDRLVGLEEVDCRDLAAWPVARLRRWLRVVLATEAPDGTHPPSAADVERALAVVVGDVVACELPGGRRLARSGQRLRLS